MEGIEQLTASDICFARQLGYAIKLLGIIKADADGEIEVRVHPTLIPEKHVLASVNGVFNALAVQGDIVGDTLFYGRGAGQDPTVERGDRRPRRSRATRCNRRGAIYGFMPHGLYGTCKPIDADRLGVLPAPFRSRIAPA